MAASSSASSATRPNRRIDVATLWKNAHPKDGVRGAIWRRADRIDCQSVFGNPLSGARLLANSGSNPSCRSTRASGLLEREERV